MVNTNSLLIPINPFQIGTSYVKHSVGYQEQLKTIRESIRYKNALMVTGLPQTGKTTLLKQIEVELSQKVIDRYQWIYLDVGGKPYRPQEFWFELAQLLKIESSLQPQTTEQEQPTPLEISALNDTDFSQKVAEKIFQISRDAHLILVIDGFDLLIVRDRFPADFFVQLENALVAKVALLFSSYRTPSDLCAQIATYVSKVPKDFLEFIAETIYLPGLHPSEIFDFCQYSLHDNPIQFTEEEIVFIVENSGGIPSLMQWIASTIFDLKLDLFDEETVSQKANVLQKAQDNFKENNEWFINYFWPSIPSQIKMGLLLLIVRNKLVQTGSRWSPRLMKEILQNYESLLLSLVDYGMLQDIPNDFVFKSKLLLEWINKYSFESNESGRLLLLALAQLNKDRERRRLADYIQWTGIELAQDVHYSILPKRGKTFQRIIGWMLIGIVLILLNLVSRFLWELLGIF